MLFCTLARKEQMAQAVVWAKSIRYFHRDSTLVLGMLEHSAASDQLKYFDQAIFISNNGVPAATTESGCAAKVTFIKIILDSAQSDMLVYLDPETRMYSPFEEVHQLLQSHHIVAIPYHLEPRNPGQEAERIHQGVFNTDFLGLRNSSEAKRFMDWWLQVVHASFYGPSRDLYADNRWLDSTIDIHSIHILKDPAYDISAWNLAEPARKIIIDYSGIKLRNGKLLRSFNYYNPNGILDREIRKLDSGRSRPLRLLLNAYQHEVHRMEPKRVKKLRPRKQPIRKPKFTWLRNKKSP